MKTMNGRGASGRWAGASVALAFLALAPTAHADEGMWPFDMVPTERIQKEHGTTLGAAWLDRVRVASVRFDNGGSGSFVSPTGLVLTNHHVASDCIAKLGRAGEDYFENGYIAGKDGPEAACPDLELNVLLSMEDVTEKVRAARKPDMSSKDANAAMKGAMSQLEKSCADRQGARCDVITLYAGARYELYTYKKYTDVRLVFAPEQSIAFFGGEPDNFTYPRFDLDMAIFRVYENGRPLRPKEYLPWNSAGPKEGDVVFVSGHPGSTGRMQTVAQLTTLRDTVYPYYLDSVRADRDALRLFAKEGHEAAREATDPIHSFENGLKAVGGFQRGLKNPTLMKKKAADEGQLRKAIDADPKWKSLYGSAWDDIATAQKKMEALYRRYYALEVASRSELLSIARDLVRLPVELDTPNEKRLREYRDSNLDSLKLELFSPAPLYGGVQVALIRTWLERVQRDLGATDPTVKSILAGRSPERAAREIVAGSKLFDVYARRALEAGGKKAIAESTDPAIVAMRTIDPEARAIRTRYEDETEAPLRKATEAVAQAVFAVRGTNMAPDATFSLRLSIGTVKGYSENGQSIPWKTDFSGLYSRATGVAPLKLPLRWLRAKSTLDMKTPFDFVSTNDIIGGNSGSPVVNAAGEIVGLIFDGNLSSLPNRFIYGDATQRAVSVDTAGMTEALKKVYGADALLKELSSR